jgi:hypothetical protein
MGGATGAGGASGLGGTGAGGAGCLVTIAPVSPPSFADIEAGPGARMRVRGTVAGARTSPVVWQWTVTFEDLSPRTTTAIDGAGAMVEFPIDKIGTYDIKASVTGDPLCSASRLVTSVAPRPAAFILRANIRGYPVQDTSIELASSGPQPTVGIRLDAGVPTTLSPTRAGSGAALPSYVRITLPASGFNVEGDTLNGPFVANLLSQVSYDLLIVPSDNPDVAPDLLSGTAASWGSTALDGGIPVAATLRDGAGRPVAGARVVLRRGELPSTIAVSDASGALTLRARAGRLAAFIVPPASTGLPRISVGASGDPGIALDGAAPSLTLGLVWNPVVTAALSVEVRTPDGMTAMPGAVVRVISRGSRPPDGTLTARAGSSAPVMLPGLGVNDVELATGATGVAVFPPLPVGSYDVTVVPAAMAGTRAPAAITSLSVTLPAAGLSQTVTLAPKAQLAGRLLPLTDSPGAQVTAIDQSTPAGGSVVTAPVGADGTYTLVVDPGRSYRLLAEPPPGVMRARAVLATVTSTPGTTQVGDATLPVGRPVSGIVMSGQGLTAPALRNVLIQAFCPAVSTKCLDPTFPLADAISGEDGSFRLVLPEPAN